MHLEVGLLHTRGKQSFTQAGEQESKCEPQCKPSNLSIDDLDLLDFNQLSEHLITGAASANNDKDVGDDDKLTPPTLPLRITIPPLNSATPMHQATQVKKTSIPLKILFKYPTKKDLPLDGMNLFWRGGVQNLENEMEAYEILCFDSSEEILNGSNIEIPAMQID